MPRRHSDQTRADALADVPTLGISGVAKKHGLGKATISRWAEEAGIGTVRNEQTAAATEAAKLHWEARRADMVHRIGQVAEAALDRVSANIAAGNSRESKDYATTMAILVDKAQLLSGGSTQRHDLHAREGVLSDARDRGLRLVND